MNINEKIFENFDLTDKEKEFVNVCLAKNIDLDRVDFVLDIMSKYHLQKDVMLPYLLQQLFKADEEQAKKLQTELDESENKLYEAFKLLKGVQSLTKDNESEDIRRMFMAICQDMRVVIVKFATILYDLKQIKPPLTSEAQEFAIMVRDIFAPLAERLGLSQLKNEFEDLCFELLEPKAYAMLKNDALLKSSENAKQLELTKRKLLGILSELNIKGEIQSRQKHFYSVYKKLVKKNISLGKVYDLVAMRVLVPTVENCYEVFGKIHAIYKPIQGRVKDYIANPKPNGYQSLHTTIVADNQRPLEIQIRTFEMHKQSEYGVAAHWIYKERRTQNKFDQKMTWFRQMLENSSNLSNEEFVETLKIDLYGESIFVQTPKGKILELPVDSTIIDFAYAIHSEIGNKCVGGKVNGVMKPITTSLNNGDVVQILTNPNSKGPSRDWLKHVKTGSARSKIKSYFKTELKEENIRLGKQMLEQAIKAKNITISKPEKDNLLLEVVSNLQLESMDILYAELGAGSLSINSVMGRFTSLYTKNKIDNMSGEILTIKKNKDGVLIDGDSGLLVRYAGCCTPVYGDEIVGYISRGRGVTIHQKSCSNLKSLEVERLINAKWQDSSKTEFTTKIKLEAENSSAVITAVNNFVLELKTRVKGFAYKLTANGILFELVVQIANKNELDALLKKLSAIKDVHSVYRDNQSNSKNKFSGKE